MLRITARYDDLTRVVEITRTDHRPIAVFLEQDQPATRLIRLPLGFTFPTFQRDLQSWLDGELIQRALPYFNRDDRTWMTSGPAAANLPPEEEY